MIHRIKRAHRAFSLRWLARCYRLALLLLMVGLAGCAGPNALDSALAPLPDVTAAQTPPAAEPSAADTAAIPRTLARVRIGFDGDKIVDARADLRQGVLYVTDSSPRLHVLDIDTFVEIVTMPAGGQLTLDADRNRLYAASDAGVAVIDTSKRSLLATLPGTHVAVDAAHGRLYVGERLQYGTADDAPGVRLYDADTLELIATGTQPGIPVYNPLRNELLIVAYTVYTAHADTLALIEDLLPQLSEQSLRWCNGCDIAQGAAVFPEEDLLAVEVVPLAVGGGAGTLPPPRFWSASTLTPDPAASAIHSFQPLCSERRTLRPLVHGRAYRSTIFQRYVTLTNLSVYDQGGVLLDWRDGIEAGFVNAGTGQSYMSAGFDRLRAVRLDRLEPMADLPIACVLEHDPDSGRIYGAHGGDLYILAERGGETPSLPPVAEALPAEPVLDIIPAAADETLFALLPGRIYRSMDGRENWERLRGGLPEGASELVWSVALSPDFGADQTIFAGGHRGTAWGEGVWRSEDAGESWQPMWRGLQHLRVERVTVSPAFAEDATLVAYAQYDHLAQGEAGASAFRSTDGGLGWSLVSTATAASALPSPATLFDTGAQTTDAQTAALPIRVDATGRGLEHTVDGQAWQPVDVQRLLSPDSYVLAILPAPAATGVLYTGVLYVVAEYEVLRTPDSGQTWERWLDPRLEGRDFTNKMTAAALGESSLFLGTTNGEVWTLRPDDMAWGIVRP